LDKPLARLLILAGMLMVAASPSAMAGLASVQERIEAAYHDRDADGLEQSRRELLAHGDPAMDGDQVAYLAAYARFRQALLAEADQPRAREYLDLCIADLQGLVLRRPDHAEAIALLGSCYGISTRYYPLALATRGLKARAHMTAARGLAPDNPWVLLQDGLADYATPALFGGDRRLALRKLERAAAMFGEAARDGSRIAAWAAMETCLQLAGMYRETGHPVEAEQALARAGTLRPAPQSAPVGAALAAIGTRDRG